MKYISNGHVGITVNGRFTEYDRSEWKRFFNNWVIIELGMIISIHIMRYITYHVY